MAYTKTTFVNGGAPGISATELNKIGDGIHDAAATADTANGTANAALPKAGGQMAGDIDANSNGISNLQAPGAANDAARLADVTAIGPWLHSIDPMTCQSAASGLAAIRVDSACLHGGYAEIQGNTSYLAWDVVLSAGTWAVYVMGLTNTDNGISTLSFDAADVGTMDWYAGLTKNVIKSVTGIAVAASGKVRVKLRMATKNASSSDYTGEFQHVQLIRTA